MIPRHVLFVYFFLFFLFFFFFFFLNLIANNSTTVRGTVTTRFRCGGQVYSPLLFNTSSGFRLPKNIHIGWFRPSHSKIRFRRFWVMVCFMQLSLISRFFCNNVLNKILKLWRQNLTWISLYTVHSCFCCYVWFILDEFVFLWRCQRLFWPFSQ